MRRLRILTTVLLLALAVAAAAAAKPVTVKFKTGTYSAKTSQGAHFGSWIQKSW
jgi:TRAP-type C4-dicarboxylate transport system substrate-binding protein